MASIINDPNGRKRIAFFPIGSKKRKAIRLGAVSKKFAESFCSKVETLAADAFEGREHTSETLLWLKGLDSTLRDRLAKTGLVKSAVRAARTLKPFLTDYFASIEVKEGTETAYRHTERCLLEHFGDMPLSEIGPEQGAKFKGFLKSAKLSTATVSRRVKVARQMFAVAKRWKVIAENPLADVAAGSEKNRGRMRFINEETARKVLDACPDTEWKLIFALSRWGGLRCPSEHLALTWADIKWDQGRFIVRSSKTEHHEGGAFRETPIFPELHGLLMDQFSLAEPGAVHVITRYRGSNTNLRTRLLSILTKAGVEKWPKLFQNLRSTRQTELAELYPIHVVCAWLGNSEAVAKAHYLQVTDEHFEQAAQKAARQPSPMASNSLQTEGSEVKNPRENELLAEKQGQSSGRSRTRISSKNKRFLGRKDESGAKSGARDSIPDEIRMKRALASIAAAFKAMSDRQGVAN